MPLISIRIEPGKINVIKLTVKRLHGFDGALKVSVKGLPPDEQCAPVDISEKASDATLKFIAAAEAKPFSGAFQIVLAEASGAEHRAVFEMTSGGENNGVPQGFSKLLINTSDELWLTVLPAKK